MNQEPQLLPESKSLYFDLQADFGITKHMGGRRATRELAELCHIHQDTYVLEVGCGIGTTSCYLASEYGCQVLAVDLSDRMVARAIERAKKREGHSRFRKCSKGMLFEECQKTKQAYCVWLTTCAPNWRDSAF